MKGCLTVIGVIFVFVLFIGAIANHHSDGGSTSSGSSSDSAYSNGGVSNSGPYVHKASSSISRASKLVGNFPTGQDTADYAIGLAHIANLHQHLGNFTIYQVLSEGRAVREQQAAAREAERQRAEAAASSARAAEEANFMQGDPDCLVLDRRSLGTDSDDYVGYVTGTVKNTCDRSFDYVQVEINFYHPDGSLEDSGLANVNNLQSGDSWHFKTISQGSGGGTWRVEKVSGM
jgi:hypothetical protein